MMVLRRTTKPFRNHLRTIIFLCVTCSKCWGETSGIHHLLLFLLLMGCQKARRRFPVEFLTSLARWCSRERSRAGDANGFTRRRHRWREGVVRKKKKKKTASSGTKILENAGSLQMYYEQGKIPSMRLLEPRIHATMKGRY